MAGRVVAITGGAGGIGRALGKAFVEAGAKVALLDLDLGGLEEAGRLLAAESMIVECDITDPESAQQAIEQVLARFGRLDILVNNAGISHRSLFLETEPDVLRRVMEVNFFGAVNCTRAALNSVIAQRGWIITISSIAGFAPLVGRTGYSASKHALHGFFDSLRAELKRTGVTVLLACPWYTATPIREVALSGDGGRVGRGLDAATGLLQPAEVASQIVTACNQRRRLVIVGRAGRLSWWISHLAPRLYEILMRRSQRSEFAI